MLRGCSRICKMKFKLLLQIFTGLAVFVVLCSLRNLVLTSFDVRTVEYPILIWWTEHFPGIASKFCKCEHEFICELTNIRGKRFDKNAAGFLFYGSDLNFLDLPLPRRSKEVIWGLLHEESPRNNLILLHNPVLELFNYSATISRHSDVPLTLQYLGGLKDLSSSEHFISTQEKNSLLPEIAPILYIQSDCDTSSYRDDYVKELMKYIPIDSYGKCLNNKVLPKEFGGDYLNNLDSNDFLNFVARYKFTIAFENGICDDYITEKLWRPLKVGSVPIYLGSPSIRDWLPNQHSAIIAQEFGTPKQLATYIEYLNTHDEKYESYLQHITSALVTNQNLINALQERLWDNVHYNFVDHFECFVCKKMYEKLDIKHFKSSVVDQSHYNCPKPSHPLRRHNYENGWLYSWEHSEKIAQNINNLLINLKKSNITQNETGILFPELNEK